MANLTLKNIPEEIHERLKNSANANFRSLTQETFARLQMSFEMEQAATTKLYQQWIDEAIASGPARPGSNDRWEKITARALARVRRGKK